ncbi:MAG: alpha/beta hydrolase-fold protein [Planctomycetota bacterium]|nr:alpha/beta hydrolase-fold protein [Planctomycetota bacterium]
MGVHTALRCPPGFSSCLVLLLVSMGQVPLRPAWGQSKDLSSTSAKLESITLESKNIPGAVGVHVLLPPNADAESGPWPLMLWLHGGGGDDISYLERILQPLVEKAWERKELPPMVVAVPSGRRSFYMDFKDGKEKWETFLVQELLPALRDRYKVSDQHSDTYVGGYSMGGMGSLRLAFKYPGTFSLVAAVAPAIEPSYRFEDIEPRDRVYRSDATYERIFGRPVDRGYWARNHPPTLARDQAARLVESQLDIYFEVGDQDELGLDRGAEFLHNTLLKKGVPHEYRLIQGVGHGGNSMPNRLSDALRYVGRVKRGCSGGIGS